MNYCRYLASGDSINVISLSYDNSEYYHSWNMPSNLG